VVGAAIVVFIWKGQPLVKDFFARNDGLNDKIDRLLKSDEQQTASISLIQEHTKYNTLDILRITVYNEAIDIEDRLVAARRYFILGGNGKVATYVSKLVKENPSIWRTLLSITKEDEKNLLPDDLRAIA
jgi:DNA integrity scanning protein DisA with diadenylate cyclase activity